MLLCTDYDGNTRENGIKWNVKENIYCKNITVNNKE